MISIVLNGETYEIPSPGEVDWATELNAYLVALGNAVSPATALTHVRATTAAGQSMADGVQATIVFGTEVYDSNGEYDPSTGIFTAQAAGYYQVSAAALLGAYSSSGTDNFQIYLWLNNASVAAFGSIVYTQGGVTVAPCSSVSTAIHLALGDTLRVQGVLNGDTKTLVANASANWLTIDKLV